jgi:23S rRNA A1618 N6-methylase RlmF
MERKMHPRNKYAEKPPDFDLLAGLYPDFKQYVTYGGNQRPRIDWTDFNATRELTRSLLYHDYGISWWIPDGQLCPTVPNRANYIHWIEDLLALAPAPWHSSGAHQVAGIDIGTGANCIYPLLGASMHGWSFVGTDITTVALEWAKWNLESNPHVSALIEVRNAVLDDRTNQIANELNDGVDNALPPSADNAPLLLVDNAPPPSVDNSFPASVDNALTASGDDALPPSPESALPASADNALPASVGNALPPSMDESEVEEPHGLQPLESKVHTDELMISSMEPPGNSVPAERSLGVLVGVVSENERFDFCMCNPPFFASMEEAGLNPRTACGGTEVEMVCPGGEEAFVARIIEDSVQLKHTIHWFTTMVGRKVTLKGLTAKLWALGAAAVRTTEFVQGRTSRWGLAWSFTPPPKAALKKNSGTLKIKNDHSFMLEV